MKVLGVFRANGLELVDIEIRSGSILPGSCPGDLNIACNDCRFSVSTRTGAGTEKGLRTEFAAKKKYPVPLMLCYWHEKNGETGMSV